MASVYRSGGQYILQVGSGRDRRAVRLGRINRDGSRAVELHANQIENTRGAGVTPGAATLAWLASIDDRLHAKLARVGLVEGRADDDGRFGIAHTFGSLFDQYAERRPELKHWTRSSIKTIKRVLVDHFGALPVTRITRAAAKDFARGLKGKYATSTISAILTKARAVLNDAVDREIIATNPFHRVGKINYVNEARTRFVTLADILQVVQNTQNPQWRLLIMLARVAGIRCPSEAYHLRIRDIDREAKRITIRSTKTEDQGKPMRVIPLWPELLPHIDAQIEAIATRDGQVDPNARLLPMLHPRHNPNTHFRRLIKEAGVTPWPKLFVNLRSSRETELLDDYPLHVVCKWIGNSERVARKHYLQVRQREFDAATQRAAQGAALEADALAQLAQDNPPKPPFQGREAGNGASGDSSSARDRDRTKRRNPKHRRDQRRSAARRAALSAEARLKLVDRKIARAYRRMAKREGARCG